MYISYTAFNVTKTIERILPTVCVSFWRLLSFASSLSSFNDNYSLCNKFCPEIETIPINILWPAICGTIGPLAHSSWLMLWHLLNLFNSDGTCFNKSPQWKTNCMTMTNSANSFLKMYTKFNMYNKAKRFI